jgi:GNAT superfamily N-acetyltransferase
VNSVVRRLELLKLEGLGFSHAEIVNELSQKLSCTKRVGYKDFETREGVSRLVVLPDYRGIGIGNRLLNFIAELCTSQTKIPFYILTSNPQIIRGDMRSWKVTRFGHSKPRKRKH